MPSRAPKLGLGGLLLAIACTSEPEVTVHTEVGAKQPAALELEHVAALFGDVKSRLEVAVPAIAEAPAANSASVGDPPPINGPAQTPSEMEALIAAVRSASLDEIEGPARRIAASQAEAWPAIAPALMRERVASKRQYKLVLDTIGGDVPNRYGHFERAWKKNHGYDVKLSTDWFEDLLALPKARVSAAAHPIYRDCVLRSALLRAAVSSGRDPALARAVIELLLEFAYAHDGTFRDEVGRAIAAIGDEAVPALIAAGTVPPNVDEDGPEASRAAYARFNLDRMDRLHPSGAIAATRANPRLLAATLEAYGIAKPTEAAPSLVELVDDANLRVRKAARAALLEYLRGPAPTVARRNVRLLGGQTASARAYLSYRDRAIEALRTAVATVAPDVLLAECDLARPRHDCDEVVERQASAYLQWLDERRREQEREAIERALAAPDDDEALAAIDRLLARNPELEPEQALARFVTDAARRREASDEWQRAGQLYRKAAHLWSTLDPERARKIKLRALVAEMNVPELNDGGRSMLLMEAAELAPENAKLQRLARRSEHLDAGDEIPLQLLGAWALAMFGLGLLGPLTRPLRR